MCMLVVLALKRRGPNFSDPDAGCRGLSASFDMPNQSCEDQTAHKDETTEMDVAFLHGQRSGATGGLVG
jgi:hypothetical protein